MKNISWCVKTNDWKSSNMRLTEMTNNGEREMCWGGWEITSRDR